MLPCIERGVPYTTSLQFFTPPAVAGITIDSIVVTSFNDFPQGIGYTCSPPACKSYPWEFSCVTISGISFDTVGSYLIKYNGYAYTSQGRASFSYLQSQGLLPEYRLLVIDSGAACRNSIPSSINNDLDALNNIKVFPNPTTSNFTVSVSTLNLSDIEIAVNDVMGRTVKHLFVNNDSLKSFEFDMQDSPKGVYSVNIKTATGTFVRKVLVQ
jgi:hypothetical protein